MTRSLKIAFAGLAVLLAVAPGHAQLRVAQPLDIVDAVGSCMAATSVGSIDIAQLAADGWSSAPLVGRSGAVDTPLRFFGRKQSAAMIMTAAGTSSNGLCIATARVATLARFAEVERALATRFGGTVVERKPGETTFMTGGKIVSLALTGKRTAPAVRIGVMQMPQERK